PHVDPDAVLLLERREQRIGVVECHRRIQHNGPLALRLGFESRRAIRPLIEIEIAVRGRRLLRMRGCDAERGERKKPPGMAHDSIAGICVAMLAQSSANVARSCSATPGRAAQIFASASTRSSADVYCASLSRKPAPLASFTRSRRSVMQSTAPVRCSWPSCMRYWLSGAES